MNEQRNEQLSSLISSAIGSAAGSVVRTRNCPGGCIHRAEIVTLADGRAYFVKSSKASAEMFRTEALGLEELAQADVLRVPRVIARGRLTETEDCLVLEAIQSAQASKGFFESLGSGLAELHIATTPSYFGWHADNFLGTSRQINNRTETWMEFFRQHRLRPQLRMARNQGLGSVELYRLTERLIERLDEWLEDGPPSLLHGDLWSGNYLADEMGEPVVFDPAVVYGHREFDLAMPLLFGGFPNAFFDAYLESGPLEDGWRERVEFYQLYHLLNHLNLFGSGYLECCLEIVRKYG